MKRQDKRVAASVPLGYRADPRTKKLVSDPEQSTVVRYFFELASNGSRPSDLASLANLKKWKDHRGETGKWTARRISKLLPNPAYVGDTRNGNSLSNEFSRSAAAADEITDVLMFALQLTAVCGIDTSDAIRSKLKANAAKYPVETSKGSRLKYDQL